MQQADLPIFPEFVLDQYHWVTTANLPSWAGYHIADRSYGGTTGKGRSEGLVQLSFAPEGRDKSPLSPAEINLVRWVVENEADVHEAMLGKLFDEYPEIREKYSEWLGKSEAKRLLPRIRTPQDLKNFVRVVAIHVHQIEKDGKPFIGVELGCDWEVEHGVGILIHGTKALELGGADTAFVLWIAEKYV